MAPPATGDALLDRRFHYIFDTTRRTSPPATTDPADPPPLPAATREWVAGLPTAVHVAVVGRCDDLGPWANNDPARGYNRGLADNRATQARQQLIAWGLDGRSHPRARRAERLPCGHRLPRRHADGGHGQRLPGRPTRTCPPTGGLRADPCPRSPAGAVPSRRPLRLHASRHPGPRTQRHADPGPDQAARAVPGADPTTEVGPSEVPAVRKHPQYRVALEVEWNDQTAAGLGDSPRSEPRHWCSGRVRRSSSRRRAPGRPR